MNHVKTTLAGPRLHDQWDEEYGCTSGGRAFADAAFEWLHRRLGISDGFLLDAGCGTGADAIQLARRGRRVLGLDFSAAVLATASAFVEREGLSDRVRLARGDLLSLPLPDDSVDHVLCWGVLMHVPDIETALGELGRVLRPGGVLSLSEINLHSLQGRVFGGVSRLAGRRTAGTRTEAGREHWFDTPSGRLLVRHTDLSWLTRTLEERGLTLEARSPGEFTELYLKVRSPFLRGLIHRFNLLWFRSGGTPRLSFGNLLLYRKGGGGGP